MAICNYSLNNCFDSYRYRFLSIYHYTQSRYITVYSNILRLPSSVLHRPSEQCPSAAQISFSTPETNTRVFTGRQWVPSSSAIMLQAILQESKFEVNFHCPLSHLLHFSLHKNHSSISPSLIFSIKKGLRVLTYGPVVLRCLLP